MRNVYRIFCSNVKEVTDYYLLLVEETRHERLVGSTNEWVLDNYYLISEQEKVMRVDLRSREFRRIAPARMTMLQQILHNYLSHCYHQLDKGLLFRYLNQVQLRSKDYLSYPEVCALPVLIKHILIGELADLCRELRNDGAFRYQLTDSKQIGEQQLERAAQQNLMMMNIFNSLKRLSKLPMAELIEGVSFSERMLMDERAGMYDQMYDRTKDDYRNRIVRLSRKLHMSEYELVKRLVMRADAGIADTIHLTDDDGRLHRPGKPAHVGWQLFPPKRWKARSHWYVAIVALATLLLSAAMAALLTHRGAATIPLVMLAAALLLLIPMSQVVIDLFNHLLYRIHKPRGTFRLKFKDGLIPEQYATMVIMPTILKNKEKTIALLEQLEVYYLSNINRGGDGVRLENRQQNLYYTLVGDAAAAAESDMPWDDEVVEAGLTKVKELNEKYGAAIFNFVYRRRAWSDGENCWLGWERKRGAILHFNDLLLGSCSETQRNEWFRCETISSWLPSTPIQFIITLDTDTQLVLYSAQKLIGAIAHPLNRARLSADGRRVDAGYGIMQPRVNVDVEVTNKSRYAQLFAGLGGLDVYTTASFELYQDIFDEGSFCGKGIYDLQVFQRVLKGTFPQNLILSHDLIEGCHIRCGLINDVELFDDNPSNYLDDAKRHHRWTRGDWQIIGWLRRRVRNEQGDRVLNQVNTIGRWKIFDNLRRSVFSLAVLILILSGFGFAAMGATSISSSAWFVVAALLAVACPILFFIVGQITTLPSFSRHYKYYMTLMRGVGVVVYRSIVQFALLPKEAWMYTDALVRSCYRMLFSHKNLLNWIPSDEASRGTKGTIAEYLSKFWFNYICAVLVLALAVLAPAVTPLSVIAALFCAVVWLSAPLLMFWLGRPFSHDHKRLNAHETDEVRTLAADTWHYFDSLIREENNYLIPDNYQINRENKTDYKTSPTNIGYSLTGVICAAQLHLISDTEALGRLSHIVDTVMRLDKWNGHLFNWYGIKTLKALPNFFISTCDSGNFVACLYVVKGYLGHIQSSSTLSLSDQSAVDGLMAKVSRLITNTDFSKLYNRELDVFSIGYDHGMHTLLPYHYNNFASEARLTSFLTIAQGDAPYRHWFCLDKTLVQYKGYKGVASWYGTLFEYFMPLIFLPTFRHTLMDETYSFAIRAQRAFMHNVVSRSRRSKLPWGISETAYNELDDAKNYKYHAFGVPYLKFQNTTPDRIVLSPYSSLMAIGIDDRAVVENMHRFKKLDMYDDFGFLESYDEEDQVSIKAHYAHHQGMILASLTNYLTDGCLQRFFMSEPMMRSMETLLKEKAQVRTYIDLKVTQYKRYRYSKVENENDVRNYDGVARIPEVGVVSNGQYSVLLNDRGEGFSRFRNIQLYRFREFGTDAYGLFLFVRNLRSDRLWSATCAPFDKVPDDYHVSFASDKIDFVRTDDEVETKTEVAVLKDRAADIRRYTFTNHGTQPVDLEITTYGEVVLAPAVDDINHRVFNAMKVDSDYDAEHQSLLFSRPAANDERYYLIHKLWVEEPDSDTPSMRAADGAAVLHPDLVEYETSRLKFLGRGGSLAHADVLENRRTLSGMVGTTLDPVMAMRRRFHIPAGSQVYAYALTGFAKSREPLIQLVEQYRGAVDVEHAFKTASVFNNMRTGMSLLKGSQMRLYNHIVKYMVQPIASDSRRQQWLESNSMSQSGLWRFGISGDLPILLLELHSSERSGYAKEMLRAFEYFKVHGLLLDLVFINDADTNREGLTHFIRNMANTEHLWAPHSDGGRVYVLDGNDVSDQERTLIRTVARIVFSTRDGLTIEQQLQALADTVDTDRRPMPMARIPGNKFRVWSSLDFYNQYGGFDRDGRDYVVTNTNTPVPWVNVIANRKMGCVVSATMAGFSFAHNAQQFKLTTWSNDMVRDTASEMLLIDGSPFVPATARHGQGFSSFDADYVDLSAAVRLFVATERMEKYYQVRLLNKSQTARTIELSMRFRLVMGLSEERTGRFLWSQWNPETNSLYVRNTYHAIYSGQMLRLTASEPLSAHQGTLPNEQQITLSLSLQPGEEREVAFVMLVDESSHIRQATPNITIDDINDEYERVQQFWDKRLTQIQVETPDRAFDFMLNRWYLYQVYASRLFARAGFYQVGGATGFRDQLQDVMSVLYSDPAYARHQILDHAAHQFAEGDVLHWWHESMHLGARTTFSDDYLWLLYVTYQYVRVTGDRDILAVMVPFCQADRLAPDEAERGMEYRSDAHFLASLAAGLPLPTPETVDSAFEYASLYEHLKRAVNRSRSRLGRHGLPLMGCGDWNDGMSRVGVEGKGESVWVAFFLCDLLPKMAELTTLAAELPSMTHAVDLSYCTELSECRSRLEQAIQNAAWDGDRGGNGNTRGWFLRAYFDNGDPMGSRNNVECQIDLISQAWSILTDVATPEQKESVMRETDYRLVNREHEIIQLLTPPFHNSQPSPGYIMNYPEGVRENGGQYTHGAMWYIMAQLKEGHYDLGYFLYSLINPIHRTQTLADVLKYKVEPYCIAADIYSNTQHPGRGGWTWYTGSASWAYKTGVENVLGLIKEGDTITFAPQVPSEWNHFVVHYRYGSTMYHFRYERSSNAMPIPTTVQLVDDGVEHEVVIH